LAIIKNKTKTKNNKNNKYRYIFLYLLRMQTAPFTSVVGSNKMNIKKEEEYFLLQFDGCSKGNPGRAGAGAVLFDSRGHERWSIAHFVGQKATNNYAEYSGLLLGLKQAVIMGISHLHVQGDSLLVIRQMRGEYQVKSKALEPLYQEARQLAAKFCNIYFQHVYRKDNQRADQLSNEGLLISK